MKKFLIGIFITVLSILTFTQGRVEKEIVDDVNIVSAVGIDIAEGDNVKATAIIPVFKADKSIDNENFTETSKLAKEVINSLQKKSADPLVTGAIKVTLYGEELARQGIIQYIDALQRDPSIASKLYLSVVDGKAEEVVKQNLGNRGTGDYLATLLEHNIVQRDLPKTDLYSFLYRYYAEGMDPFLPIMKLEGNKMAITGLAIFKDEKMVDQINESDLFFFKSLVENFTEGSYTFFLEDEGTYASMQRIESRNEIKITNIDDSPKVDIYLYNKGILNEYSGQSVSPATADKLSKKVEELLIQKSEKMIKQFQEVNSDPLGIVYHIRHSSRKDEAKKWKTEYPNLEINVHAKVVITETGIVE